MNVRLNYMSNNQAALLRLAIMQFMEKPNIVLSNEDKEDLSYLHNQLTMRLQESIRQG